VRKVLAEGQLCYLEDTNKVQLYDGTSWANLGSMTNVEAFTAGGTFTPPAGVTYAMRIFAAAVAAVLGTCVKPAAGGT
jgi:hypothetical protein